MSSVAIDVYYQDGDHVHACASGKATYPQALAELRATAVAAVRETIAVTRCAVEE